MKFKQWRSRVSGATNKTISEATYSVSPLGRFDILQRRRLRQPALEGRCGWWRCHNRNLVDGRSLSAARQHKSHLLVLPGVRVHRTPSLKNLPEHESPRRLLQRHARLGVKEVNRLARSAQCQRVPNGQRRSSVNDGDELMAAGREVDVFVVAEKLDDVDGGAQLQAVATSRSVIDVLWADSQDDVAHARAAALDQAR